MTSPSTCALLPADKLHAWLEEQRLAKPARKVRLPVVMGQAQVGFSINHAHAGRGEDALELNLNDAALGIGLADRAAARCKGQETCALWVEGYWRGQVDGRPVFDVMTAGEVVIEAELASAVASVVK